MDAHALVIDGGPVALVLGDEQTVAARDLAGGGDRIGVQTDHLRVTTACLVRYGLSAADVDALVVFTGAVNTDTPAGSEAGAVQVSVFGDLGGPLTRLTHLSAEEGRAMLAEAAATAWWQRLSEAVDAAGPLTDRELDAIGAVDVPGGPDLAELHADRRRLLHAPTGQVPDPGLVAHLHEQIDRLRVTVRYGAAGMAAKEHVEQGDLADARWAGTLRQLVVTEEILAAELIMAARRTTPAGPATGDDSVPETDGAPETDSAAMDGPAPVTVQVLGARADEALLCDALAHVSVAVDDPRIPLPTGVVNRLPAAKKAARARRGAQAIGAYLTLIDHDGDDDGQLTEAWIAAYAMTRSIDQAATEAGTGIARVLRDAGARNEQGEDTPLDSETIAARLGRQFAAHLEPARARVDALRRAHPTEDAEALVDRIKRQAVDELVATAADADASLTVVATVTMAIAVARGVPPHSADQFAAVGRRVLDRTGSIVEGQDRIAAMIPAMADGTAQMIAKMQPQILRTLDRGIRKIVPGREHLLHVPVQTLRSLVSRMRLTPKMEQAAADTADKMLAKSAGAIGARLVVREIDRALKTLD